MSTIVLIGMGAICMPGRAKPVTRQTLRFCVVGGLICINAGSGGSGRFGRGDIDPAMRRTTTERRHGTQAHPAEATMTELPEPKGKQAGLPEEP